MPESPRSLAFLVVVVSSIIIQMMSKFPLPVLVFFISAGTFVETAAIGFTLRTFFTTRNATATSFDSCLIHIANKLTT